MMRAKGRASLEALKATVEQEWQQLKDIRRRITPAVTATTVRVSAEHLLACVIILSNDPLTHNSKCSRPRCTPWLKPVLQAQDPVSRASPGVRAPPRSILKRRSSIRPAHQEQARAVQQGGQENAGVEVQCREAAA